MGKVNASFGDYLRGIRTKRRESLADVSGAVEIDVALLDRIESGSVQPSEDILLLLISHYNLKEDEAVRLWQLAGYENNQVGAISNSSTEETVNTLSTDSPILFTDGVQISANKFGVIMSFLQGIGSDGKPLTVSKLGMSREHARTIVDILNKTLELSEEVKH